MTMPDKPTIENYVARARARGIPEHMVSGLAYYVVNGRPTGDFLRAVISNDLFEAMGRADFSNIEILNEYVLFFVNDTPVGCWGLSTAYKRWTEGGGLLGVMAEEDKRDAAKEDASRESGGQTDGG